MLYASNKLLVNLEDVQLFLGKDKGVRFSSVAFANAV
jgi:hypothetical protein